MVRSTVSQTWLGRSRSARDTSPASQRVRLTPWLSASTLNWPNRNGDAVLVVSTTHARNAGRSPISRSMVVNTSSLASHSAWCTRATTS